MLRSQGGLMGLISSASWAMVTWFGSSGFGCSKVSLVVMTLRHFELRLRALQSNGKNRRVTGQKTRFFCP